MGLKREPMEFGAHFWDRQENQDVGIGLVGDGTLWGGKAAPLMRTLEGRSPAGPGVRSWDEAGRGLETRGDSPWHGSSLPALLWRSDGIEEMTLGEAVALGSWRDVRATYHEGFQGFPLTIWDGTTLTM